MDDEQNQNRLYWLQLEKRLTDAHKALEAERNLALMDEDLELAGYLLNAQAQLGCAIETAATRATTLSTFLIQRA